MGIVPAWGVSGCSTVKHIGAVDRKTLEILIKTVCSATPDRWTLEVAQWATMRPGGKAEEFLKHYLRGTGLDKAVSIHQLLQEDSGVRRTVEEEIKRQLSRTSTEGGIVPIPQRMFANQDWRYATGSLNMRWKRVPKSVASGQIVVELSFRNEYRWHPKEYRISQCVHQAADNLKQTGARDYWIVGAPYRHSLLEN